MAVNEEEKDNYYDGYYQPEPAIQNPAVFLTKPLWYQLAELMYNSCLVSSMLYLVSEGNKGLSLLVRKIGMGFVGAVYVLMVLIMVTGLAIILGFGSVKTWVEEPMFLREKVCFDYTLLHPQTVFFFPGGYPPNKNVGGIVPVGHTLHASLLLLFPESDFNREIGVFQLTAELISANGDTIAKSSQPCMLRFRSLPIRIARTFLMSIPLLLAITAESQEILIPILKHREGYPRSEAIRISMIPRAGTPFTPELYESEIIINSQLPLSKEIMHNWKWTFYVWISFYIYILLLVILFSCFKCLIFFPMTPPPSFSERTDQDRNTLEVSKEPRDRARWEAAEFSESLRRWRRSRIKRKAMLIRRVFSDTVASSASREDTILASEEDAGDSESVYSG